MAKGSAMGLWKGKKGSTVFYRIRNSNNKEVQGEREYQANVKNPQSDAQADQRAKLFPVQQIKAALYDIVSRSFQGVKYGAQSRLEFIRLNMRLTSGYPFVPRNLYEPVPGEYIISKGSLGNLNCTQDDLGFATPFLANFTAGTDATIGTLSTALLSQNAGLQVGDQLTFIACLASSRNTPLTSNFRWVWFSIYLNPEDTTPLADIPSWSQIQIDGGGTADEPLVINGAGDDAVAAAVIHSREGQEGQYLRSTSKIAVSSDMAPWFETSQSATTRASYQTRGGTRATDWPVEDETEGGGGSSATDGLYTLSGLTGNLASLNGQKVQVRVNTLTNQPTAVYIADLTEKTLINEAGDTIMYTGSGSEVLFLTQNQVPALASLPSILKRV